MQIEYDNAKIHKLFSDSSYHMIIQKVGKEHGRSIKKVMNRLEAATAFNDILQLGLGKPHRLSGDLKGCYSIHLSANYRLIILLSCDTTDINEVKACNKITVKDLLIKVK